MIKCKYLKLRPLFLVFWVMLSMTNCSKYIEEDISSQKVLIEYPNQNAVFDTSKVEISFVPIDHADNYRIEIVQPNFKSLKKRVVDTLISSTAFSVELDSNDYSLVVSAQNFGYSSKSSDTILFSVSVNSSGSSLQLLDPKGAYNLSGNPFDNRFVWNNSEVGTSFEFDLRKGTSFQNGEELHSESNLSGQSLELNNLTLDHGTYWWRLIATVNGISNSKIASFVIDTISPLAPTLVSPIDNTSVNQGVVIFAWNNQSEDVQSNFELSSSPTFSTLIYSENMQGQSVSLSLTPGIFYWRVQCQDPATNLSPYSSVNKLTVN